MAPILFIFALLAYIITCAEGQSACTTPSGRRGQCTGIDACAPLLALLDSENGTSQDIDNITLKKSQCESDQEGPKLVCCPSDCFTIEGQLGTCIGIESCPHLKELISPTMSAETLSYIQRSRCEGPDKTSVCCGQSGNLAVINKKRTCTASAAPPDPRSECCGLDSSPDDIIVGEPATHFDRYPWLAIIEYKKDSSIKLMCGGALISSKYVLTAGHCVVGSILSFGIPSNVRLGEYDTSNDGQDCEITFYGSDCNTGIVVIPIERSIPHPKYNSYSNSYRHDIALLRLKQLAPYTDFIRPICLPTSDLAGNRFKTFFVAGWGILNEETSRSAVKLEQHLHFVSLETCQQAYNKFSNVSLWNKQLCADGEIGYDTYKGDSGGPLMEDNRTWKVAGVMSFGVVQSHVENTPRVYTKVYDYIPWMRSQIQP